MPTATTTMPPQPDAHDDLSPLAYPLPIASCTRAQLRWALDWYTRELAQWRAATVAAAEAEVAAAQVYAAHVRALASRKPGDPKPPAPEIKPAVVETVGYSNAVEFVCRMAGTHDEDAAVLALTRAAFASSP